MMYLNENFIFSKNNLYINFEKFENGECNFCLITGLSGSGKSTLGESIAKKYKAEYIELDIFEHSYMFENDEQLKEAGEVFYEYLMKHKDIYTKLKAKELQGKELGIEINKFLKYVLSYIKKNKKKKFVVEGVQIYDFGDPKSLKSYPMILVRASVSKSIKQRWLRNGNGHIELKKELKELPPLLKWYIGEEKIFSKFRKDLLKEGRVFNVNDISNIIESYSNIECMICETIENVLLENEYFIIKEMLSDLEKDIDSTINKFKNNSKVYSEMNRSIEQMVYIKKGIRNKNYDLIIESLNNSLCDVITMRNKYTSDYRLDDIFVENAKLIANSKLTNKINHLKYSINESYSYIQENILLEADNNANNNLDKIKGMFGSKHDKLVSRDKKFLDGLKSSKKISADMELEVPDDNNVTFDKLMSRYDNFIKSITRDNDNVSKFSDKNGDLKNGLDNYFRTGSAKKESGTKKMSGDAAITAVSNMIEYCKAYLDNKSTIIGKMDDMVSDNSDVKTESYIIFEADEQNNNNGESLSDNIKDNKDANNNKEEKQNDNNNDTKEEKQNDNNDNTEETKNDNKDENNNDTEETKNDSNKNKQIGINTLLTIIEQRYFDYIKVLRSLFSK